MLVKKSVVLQSTPIFAKAVESRERILLLVRQGRSVRELRIWFTTTWRSTSLYQTER